MKKGILVLLGAGALGLWLLSNRTNSTFAQPPQVIADLQLPPDVAPQPGVFTLGSVDNSIYRATDVSQYTQHAGLQAWDMVDFTIATQTGQPLFQYYRTPPRRDDPTNTWGNNYDQTYQGRTYEEWRRVFGI